jgi:hypothetical protein
MTAPSSIASETPPFWEEVYKRIEEIRAKHPAPVDTLGCEALSEKHTLPPPISRYHWSLDSNQIKSIHYIILSLFSYSTFSSSIVDNIYLILRLVLGITHFILLY